MSMIEPELTLFQMQGKRMFGNAVELCEPALGKAPKRFNPVDVMLAPDERRSQESGATL